MFILETKYGNDGYSFWFKLLEILAMTEGHCYHIGNSANWEFLVAKTKVTSDNCKEILDTLADLDAIDKELYDNKVIWSQNFVDNLMALYSKRKVSAPLKPTIESLRDGNHHIDDVSGDINPQSRVEESRVKKSREEESNETDVSTVQQLSELWTNCGYGTLNSNMVEKLMADVEMFSLPWVIEAIEIGNMRGKRSYSYVKGILNKWNTDGKEEVNELGRKNTGNPKAEKDYSTDIDLTGIDEEELYRDLI